MTSVTQALARFVATTNIDDEPPALREAKLTDGRVLTSRVNVAPGSPSNPLSWVDLGETFADCAACVGIGRSAAARTFEQLKALDGCPDVGAVLEALHSELPTYGEVS